MGIPAHVGALLCSEDQEVAVGAPPLAALASSGGERWAWPALHPLLQPGGSVCAGRGHNEPHGPCLHPAAPPPARAMAAHPPHRKVPSLSLGDVVIGVSLVASALNQARL